MFLPCHVNVHVQMEYVFHFPPCTYFISMSLMLCIFGCFLILVSMTGTSFPKGYVHLYPFGLPTTMPCQ